MPHTYGGRGSRGFRPTLTAAVLVAALAVTVTGCGSDDEPEASDAGASEQPAKNGKGAGDEDLGVPDKLPESLPTSMEDLDAWRDGAWKEWDRDEWLREAADFVNPYIEDHWKPSRMRKAEENEKRVAKDVASTSAQGKTDPEPRATRAVGVSAPYTRNAAPTGKIFMETPKGPMVCSGTVVQDPRNPGRSNLVATAGHCVHSGKSGGWLRNISFVPAYNDRGLSAAELRTAQPEQVAPYGEYWAEWAQTTAYWIKNGAAVGGGGSQQDFAVLQVKSVGQDGKSLEETVGAAVAVNFQAPDADRVKGVSAYGYPAARPYDGTKLYRCTDRPGRLTIDPSQAPLHRIGCTMTGGSSGGGWLINGKRGKPELVSVTSIGPNPARWLAGPRLGEEAKGAFEAISKRYAGRN
ncbi:trypsin-like serine peptidase [Streptomyces sulphureus]|uniref:trypsin-like serine peptidase n=1 Tax=Streptomyces sulphureus TaxID=47758 RepID=UPI00037DA837|nr:hypothetical protein [Streptomyces sulphureus]